jgi:hypothetical protein
MTTQIRPDELIRILRAEFGYTGGGAGVFGSGAANHIAYWSAANTLTYDNNALYWDAANNRLGIGKGAPNVEIDVKAAHPAQNFEISGDAYPVMQLFPYSHDLMAIMLDAYWDFTAGAYKSSDAGSNFRIAKNADTLTWDVCSGVAAGGAIGWINFLGANTSGYVGVGGRLYNPTPDARLVVQGDGVSGEVRLRRVNNAPAIGHIEGELFFSWADTLGGRLNYGSIRGVIDAVGTDGSMQFRTLQGGVETEKMRINLTGVGVGTSSPDRLFHTEASDAETVAITYATRTSHTTSGAAAALFGVGHEDELEDSAGNMQVASEQVTLWAASTSGAESPLLRFTTYPAGSAGPGHCGFWTYRAVAGAPITVIPNGAGDVTRGLRCVYTIYLNGGAIFSAGTITATTGGGAVDLYNAGGEQFTITAAADGSVSVVQAAGADNADIGLFITWQ